MVVKQDTVRPWIESVGKELEDFRSMHITIGVQSSADQYGVDGSRVEGADAKLLTIARVHEYGMANITPRHAQNLAIPIDKKAEGKSPKDFPGLVFIKSEEGHIFGVLQEGAKVPKKAASTEGRAKSSAKKEDAGKREYKHQSAEDMEFLFLLLPSVTIPERSFIRAGYDNGREKVFKAFAHAVSMVVSGQWTAVDAAAHVGAVGVSIIQNHIQGGIKPPKSEVTKETGKSNNSSLYSTGLLYHSITYSIQRK
ncbi:MAG: hypothetical protein LBJ11_09090 [Oscillospiraceae bacterium]|jgi:hypothetical protein|nr:hypothetical protein [Oscillospiraceae bacterium]